MSRVRILRVIARLNLGGPAHQAAILSGRRLDPERYETLLVHGSLPPGEESMAGLAEREGARTHFLPKLGQPVRPQNDASALLSLIRIVRSFDPDIVHTHTAKAGFLGRQAALLARRSRQPRLVHTYHGHVLEGYFGPLKSGLYRRLERRLGKRSDALIGVSRATVDDLVRLGVAERERFRIIPLGLDLSPFARPAEKDRVELRRELGVSQDEVLATYIGRIVPIKRLDVLIRALGHAVRDGAPVRLVVVGDGEMRPELEALAREVGVADRAHFAGYRQDLSRVFAAADLAAISSDNEGTPVSLIEAAAAGLPALGTDVGGVADVVTPETGILVPPGDDRALGAAIGRLTQDPTLRGQMGSAGRARALERYSADRLVHDIEQLYAELLGTS